jgi:hypothetical protein
MSRSKLRTLYKEDRKVIVEIGSLGEKEFIELGFKEEQTNEKESQKTVESNETEVENKPAPRRRGRRKASETAADA